MKLNVGCGNRRLEGYTGIDVVQRDAVDIVAPADKVPLADGCADEVQAIHLLEHFFEWEVPSVLAEWHRLLRSGGSLVLEMPDIIKCARNLIRGVSENKPGQLTYWGAYGDPTTRDPFMMHKFGWTFKTLKPVVEAAGFVNVAERDTKFHPRGRGVRDFRLEAWKP